MRSSVTPFLSVTASQPLPLLALRVTDKRILLRMHFDYP